MAQDTRFPGTSAFARRLSRTVRSLAQGKNDVALVGEPGTGKRTIAWEIHDARSRKKPFVLLEGDSATDMELRAALAGTNGEQVEAYTGRRLTALTDHATLCLAHAEKLAPHNQSLLVAFLKEGRKRFPGLKIVVTVQNPLERLAQSGEMGMDLVGHVEKFDKLEVPTLRDRMEDIPALTLAITKKLCATIGKPMKEIDVNTTHILSQGQWPGNIRQLVGVLGKAVMISHEDNLILPGDFLDEHQHLADAITNIEAEKAFVLDRSLDLIEKLLIQRGLKHFQYNQSRTAQIFGLSEANFRYRLKKFGLPSIRKKV